MDTCVQDAAVSLRGHPGVTAMSVLFVSEYWPPASLGGGELSAQILAEALAAAKVRVTVLTTTAVGQPSEFVTAGVRVLRSVTSGTNPARLLSNLVRALWFPISLRRQLKALLCREHFDVVHYLNVSSALGKVQGPPSVCHVNSPVFFCPKGTLMYKDREECHRRCTPVTFLGCFLKSAEFGRLQNRWYFKYNPLFQFALYTLFCRTKRALTGFDYYTPVSEFMREKLVESGIPLERTEVIPNIVRPAVISSSHRAKVPRVLYLGALVANKGLLVLLDALASVRSKFECNIYGEGVLRSELEQIIESLGLADRVQVHAWVSYAHALRLVGSHDIIVQPSLVAEAVPRAVLDGLAAGKIVVVSRVGGMKGLITQGKTGLVAEPGSVASLNSCLENAIRNRDALLKKLRPQVVIIQHSEKLVVKRLLSVYKKVLTRKGDAREC